MKMVKPVILCLLLLVALVPAQSGQRFTGVVTDNMCPTGDHSRMQMGPTAAECTIACNAAHGALYVLYDGKNSYVLSDQKTAEKFAGRKVAVNGALDDRTGTIQVNAITASE